MDLRGIANAASDTVNPNILVTVKRSSGYTVGAGQKQVPSYAPGVIGPAQIQALDSSDLKQIDGMNLQGVLRTIFLKGNLAGVVRVQSKGGDIVIIPAPSIHQGTWLIAKVLETWELWVKAVIVLQVNP
jgi:hypothetical protein